MVREKWENIIKAKTDSKDYRIVECNNRLVAALVSDPKIDKASVAMTVQVGSASDPDEIQGLAHFLEHMLFLGSEKYPAENEYKKFLIEHGGTCNASTSLDKTTFYFTVSPEHLAGAMDRFAQFFISPLLSPEATEREVNAVSMECERNRKIDRRRLMRLERWLSKMGHPYQKFSTGNKRLLEIEPRAKGINTRTELTNFYQKWYSSNLMKLAVVGQDNLDELEDKVGAFFSTILDKNVTPYFITEPPYQENETGIIYFTCPIKNRRSLTLMFPCPDYEDRYSSGPAVYMRYLLERTNKGSLYSFLRKSFWIDGKIESGLQVITKSVGKFFIRLMLTEEGLTRMELIIYSVFQYLNMIKEFGIRQSIFDEVARIANNQFEYKEKSQPHILTQRLSEQLIKIPYEDILISEHKLTDWDPDVIINLLGYLKPSNARIRVVSRKFETSLKEEDPIYGVKYRIEKIRSELLAQWADGSHRSDFHMPPEPNEKIPTDFTLVAREYPTAVKPEIVFETKFSRVWYMQDSFYNLPKTFCVLNFYCPMTSTSPFYSNLTFIMLSTIEDFATEVNWDTDAAGMTSRIEKTLYGFRLILGGFSEKMNDYVHNWIRLPSLVQFTAEEVELRKETIKRLLSNKEYDTPTVQSDYLLRLISGQTRWTTEELLENINCITHSCVESFFNTALAFYFCEGLIYGNVRKEDAIAMWSALREFVPRKMNHLTPNQMNAEREIVFPYQMNLMYEKEEDVHTSSCTTAYFHLGTYNFETAATAELFHQYIKEPVFTVLRTKEQLAYSVFRGVDRTQSCLGLYVRLLTEKHPRFVDDRIEKLITTMGANLANIGEDVLAVHKQSLIDMKRTVAKKMSHKCDELFEEIAVRQYCFDRKDREIAIIHRLDKQNLIDFYEQYIKPGAPYRRRLSIFVRSTAGDQQEYIPHSDSISYERIKDILQFKNSCYCYPLLHVANPRFVENTDH